MKRKERERETQKEFNGERGEKLEEKLNGGMESVSIGGTASSTLGGQLGLDVHSADGALLIGQEPLVHTQLMEQMHTWQTPAGGRESKRSRE